MCALERDRKKVNSGVRVYYFVNNMVCILRVIAYYVAFIHTDY